MDQLAQRLFDSYWSGLTIPARHQDLDPKRVDRQAWIPIMKSIDSLFTTKPRGMFLTGPVGTGKTAILWLIREEYAKRMAEVYATNEDVLADARQDAAIRNFSPIDEVDQSYIEDKLEIYYRARMCSFQALTHTELIQELRNSVDENGELTRHTGLFKKETILLLDDLGRGYDDKGGWNLSLQDEYFDLRWKNDSPTFVTTNLTGEQLRAWPGWTRIIDRLVDPSWMQSCTVAGESKRK